MKKEIRLNRIHCVGCATNLEDKIREVEGVKQASIDFINKIVSIEVDSKNANEVEDNVKKCIKSFDSSIKIIESSEEDKAKKREKIQKYVSLISLVLCVCILLIASFFCGTIRPLQISLYIVAYLIIGYEVLFDAVKNIFRGKMLDEKFLMSIATIGALVLQDYVEAIAVMFLYSIGEMLQGFAVEKSKRRIKSLMSIKSESATLIINNEEVLTRIEEVKVGDIMCVKPGEKVPLDSVVVSGNSYLNTSAITGESKEMFVKAGDEVLSGYINTDSVLMCKVTKTEKESTVTKIINMVENATKTKAKTERFITRFCKWYTPIVVGVAVLLTIIPVICGAPFSTWFYRSLTFLVVSCPCALVISVPLGYFAGIGVMARNGILVKGSSFLEALAKVDTVVYDKTGTLTYGQFEVTKVWANENSNENEVIELIAYAENFSNHRIARSIVKKYSKPINIAFIEDYKEIAGEGVKVTLFGEKCLVGNYKLLTKNGIDLEEVDEAGTIVYLAKSGEYLGYVLVEDKIKEDSYALSENLKKVGIKNVSIFTGDNEKVAKSVAAKLNIDNFYASLSPSGKVETLKKLKDDGKNLAFVGDGINDAPVLASVDVGISMGGVGSDVAVETSDVVLMTDEPSKVADAVKIAKKTRIIVYENVSFILLVKVAVLTLSALGISGMWLAIFADVGLSILAILNSLRAMIFKKTRKSKKD